jgi:hypothetical protein
MLDVLIAECGMRQIPGIPGVKSFLLTIVEMPGVILLTIVVRPQVKYASPRLNMLRPRGISFAFHPSTMVPTYGAGRAGISPQYDLKTTGQVGLIGFYCFLSFLTTAQRDETEKGQSAWGGGSLSCLVGLNVKRPCLLIYIASMIHFFDENLSTLLRYIKYYPDLTNSYSVITLPIA